MRDTDRRSSSSLPAKKSDAPAHTFRSGSTGDDAPPSFAEATNDPPPPSPCPPPPSVQRVAPTLRGLFRFTTRRDLFTLILPGLIFSGASGVIQPLMTIILGKAFQAFTDYSLSASHIPRPTPPGWLNARGNELTNSIQWVCIMLAVLAFANVVVVTIATTIWVAHGSLVTKRLQETVYGAVQGKELAWIDTGMVGLEIEGEKDEKDTEEEDEEGDHVKASSSALMGHFLSLTDDVRIATTGTIGQVVQYTVTLLSALGIALHSSWQLTLATLATLPLVILASGLCERALVPRFLKDQELNAQGMAKVEQVVGAISTVKAFNAEKTELSAFANVVAKLEANYRPWTVVLGVRSGVVQFLCLSVFAQGFGLGSFLVTSGRASAGNVNTVFWACMIASSMMQTLLPAQTRVDKGKAAMARLVSLIEATTSTPPPPTATVNIADPPPRESFTTAQTDFPSPTKPPVSPRSPSFVPVRRHKSVRKPTHDHVRMRRVRPADFSGELALSGVTFHYPSRPHPAPPALYDVSLYIPPRETTYIVGSSGSGKSTVAALLLGLYRPDQGTVEAEEQGLEWLDEAWLRSHVGCVSQGTAFLIEGTVHDNVALGGAGRVDWAGRLVDRAEERVPREEVERACRAAMVHDFIIDLPDGYDTWLSGEKGASLSGGQRQRIALAKAFIRNPTVLVLDEATSALDATTRLLVHEAVKATRRNKTTVCITHDLSPIQPGDFVYVMQEGEVVQQGYRSELESTGGAFADMISLQAQQPIRQITFDDPSWEVPTQMQTPAATTE